MSHSNISIFVPHFGCPNQCSFCNQRFITGKSCQPTKNDVIHSVEVAVKSPKYDKCSCEIAFFGGSFTAIDKSYMLELLSAAYDYVKKGIVSGIRISTRPDCIDDSILLLLKDYGVTAIELGAQSMVDSVLLANERGHSSDDVRTASSLIKSYGFELGLQMMTGLYKSSNDYDMYTASQIAKLKPSTVRIYPTITLKNTYLETLYNSGEYIPPSLDDSVKLCADVMCLFEECNIKVIRLGLHTIDSTAYVAGPWHPAFSELCSSFVFRNKVTERCNITGKYVVYVNDADVSKFIGQKKSNLTYFKEIGLEISVKSDSNISKNDFIIEEVK